MIRVGICGAGFIAQAHAQGYAAQPDTRVAVVVDPRLEHAERLAAKLGATAGPDVEALLGPDVDVVSICTPTPTHADLAIAAMRAGKHVLCEKPIARTAAEAEAMIAAAEENDVKLSVGHVVRYEEDHRRARELVAGGAIGRLRMASQSITGPFPDWSAGGWFADVAQSGGPVLDLAVHSFDFLRWIFGSPVTRVSAVGVRRKIALPGYALVTLRFADGGLGLVEASWLHPRAHGLQARTELLGTGGRIAWDYESIAAVEVTRDDAKRAHLFTGEVWAAQVADFLRCVRDDAPPPVPGREALAAQRVGLAALESIESGRAVDLGEDPSPVKARGS